MNEDLKRFAIKYAVGVFAAVILIFVIVGNIAIRNLSFSRIATLAPIHIIIAAIASLAVLFKGYKQWEKYRKVADLSTSKARSMAAGLVELSGKVLPIALLTSPVTKHKCVYFKVEHQRKAKSSWYTTGVEKAFKNFYLQDETGKVEVAPEQAEIDIPYDHIRNNGELLFRTRDVEYYLAPGDDVYILGTAKNKPGVKTAKNEENFIITKGEGDPFFYITDKKESELRNTLYIKAIALLAGGAVLFVIFLPVLIAGLLCIAGNYCI